MLASSPQLIAQVLFSVPRRLNLGKSGTISVALFSKGGQFIGYCVMPSSLI